MGDALRLLELIVNGAAGGCIYGLIALGFVLIYKATELVNFAQGDIMMLGGFAAFSFVTWFGFNYWVAALCAVAITAAFGFLIDALIIRRVIGQPQFAVVMLTLGSGIDVDLDDARGGRRHRPAANWSPSPRSERRGKGRIGFGEEALR